jgi:hypothetical protein
MFNFLRAHITCPALTFTASASGMRAAAVEWIEAVPVSAISINQYSPKI